MQYLDALQAVGGLGKPSKMPWWSWSISATECITGSKLAEVEGTVCSGCYALKGNYRFANVVLAVRIVDAEYGTVVWSGTIQNVVEDKVPAIIAPKLRR